MNCVRRELEKVLTRAVRNSPALVFAGPRCADQQGLEVDFLIPRPGGSTILAECKAGRTVTPAMTAALRQLGAAMKRKRRQGSVEMFLVHQSPDAGTSTQAVAPGVRALAWQRFVAEL